MRLVFISDTHNLHKKIKVPDGDILIHSGDATSMGHMHEIKEFNKWLGTLPHKHKIFVAGNHDWLFQKQPLVARSLITNATYLEDEEINIDGISIYGSPWQPYFCNWAFNLPRGEALKEKWDKIPEKVDILVTHGPPYSILDANLYGENCGCEELHKRVFEVKPKIHAFGHIHLFGSKTRLINDVLFVNASICDESYRPVQKPMVIDYESKTATVV